MAKKADPAELKPVLWMHTVGFAVLTLAHLI